MKSALGGSPTLVITSIITITITLTTTVTFTTITITIIIFTTITTIDGIKFPGQRLTHFTLCVTAHVCTATEVGRGHATRNPGPCSRRTLRECGL